MRTLFSFPLLLHVSTLLCQQVGSYLPAKGESFSCVIHFYIEEILAKMLLCDKAKKKEKKKAMDLHLFWWNLQHDDIIPMCSKSWANFLWLLLELSLSASVLFSQTRIYKFKVYITLSYQTKGFMHPCFPLFPHRALCASGPHLLFQFILSDYPEVEASHQSQWQHHPLPGHLS